MVSIRTERCSRPRPETLNASRSSLGSTRRATFDSSSRSSRSLRCREVRYCPSPVSGESLTREEHAQGRLVDLDSRQGDRVLGVGDRVADVDGSQADDRDDVAGLGCFDLGAAELVEDQHAVDRAGDDHVRRPSSARPSARAARGPATIRPMAIRPTYSEKSRVVQSMRNGPSGSTTGPGHVLDDHVEERLDVARGRVRDRARRSRPCPRRRCTENRADPRWPPARRRCRRSR